MNFSEFNRRLHCSMVDRLKDHLIDFESFITFKSQSEFHESVRKALDSDTNRAVPHVRVPGFWDGVIVAIDDDVQVFCHTLGHFVQVLEVEGLRLMIGKL